VQVRTEYLLLALADTPSNNRALTSLNLSSNGIKGAEAGKALGDAIAGNTVLKELDISGDKHNKCDVKFVKAFAVGLHDNGAMTKFDISSNNLRAEGGKALAAGLKGNQVITELNISSNSLGINLDYGSDTSGVIAIADVIPDMGALTTLILKDNKLLTPEAGKVLSGMLAVNTVLKELDVSSNNWEEWGQVKGDGPGFAKELAVGISDNGALIKLDVSSNNIGAEKEGGLQRICAASGIELAT
jgi:hypothetical protein